MDVFAYFLKHSNFWVAIINGVSMVWWCKNMVLHIATLYHVNVIYSLGGRHTHMHSIIVAYWIMCSNSRRFNVVCILKGKFGNLSWSKFVFYNKSWICWLQCISCWSESHRSFLNNEIWIEIVLSTRKCIII